MLSESGKVHQSAKQKKKKKIPSLVSSSKCLHRNDVAQIVGAHLSHN